MRYWVLDSETTGVGEEDKAVEIGGFLCEDKRIIKHYRTFVNPGIPIPPVASAIHHITDKDVEDAPTLDVAIMPILEEEFDYVVAHNASFDKRFIDLGTAKWLCTWKLSNRVFPDAPSHANQVLRYWLGLPDPVHSEKEYAHRALYDAEVTTNLFHAILNKATSDDPWEAMFDISQKPILLKKINFGKHAGKEWKDVPRDYLDYILHKSSGWNEDVLHTARHYFSR